MELHDASAPAELIEYEELGLCKVGDGGKQAKTVLRQHVELDPMDLNNLNDDCGVQEFKDKGLTVVESDTADFEKNVLEKATFEEFGYEKADWEAIRAVK